MLWGFGFKSFCTAGVQRILEGFHMTQTGVITELCKRLMMIYGLHRCFEMAL